MGWIPYIELIKMPLPDTNNWSSRIYELLKETDLENLSYAQFKSTAETLFIEPENEDELRRLVLVQLARMAVRGDWDGFLSGGSGGAPTDADYLLAYDQGTVPASLTAARKLVVGNNISMAHGAGANDDMTISATPGGSDGQIQYNVAGVLSATGLLSTNKTNELTLVAISGDGQINISSSSKAVSLLCDENQKLKVKGATNTFILDVSSSSGGITFPDGTTQTTAASGGGSTTLAFQPITAQLDGTYSRFQPWDINCLMDYTLSNTIQDEYVVYHRFIANKTGTLSEITIRTGVTNTSKDTLIMGVYDTDSEGYPDSLQGSVTLDVNGGADLYTQTSFTSSVSITQGRTYWMAIVMTGSAGPNVSTVPRASMAACLGLSHYNGTVYNCIRSTSTASSLPASFTKADNQLNKINQVAWSIKF